MDSIKALIFLGIATCCIPLPAAQPVFADSQGSTSFSFPIFSHAYHTATNTFFIGARTAVPDNQYAIARSVNGANFTPLTPETIILDGVANQPNPLFGAQVNHLALVGENPLIVHGGEPNRIYCIDTLLQNSLSEIVSAPLLDSLGAPAGDIKGITSNSPDKFVPNESSFFAYVTPAGGGTGDNGSALVTGVIKDGSPRTISVGNSVSLDKSSPALAITNPVTILDDAVSIHFSSAIERLYLGFSVQAGGDAADGALGVTLEASPIVPASALTSNSIVGAIGANSAVSIHAVLSTALSSRLVYLVGVGGVGLPEETARSVFALPLVSDPTSSAFGMLALKSGMPVDIVEGTPPFRILTRVLRDPAVNPGDLFEPGDLPAMVGGGAPLPGPVRDIVAITDGIIVSVEQSLDATEAGGLFLSRAILDPFGRVAQWSAWQRVSSIAGSIFGLAYDGKSTSFWAMLGSNSDSIDTVLLTGWRDDTLFAKMVNRYFSSETAGIQGIVSLPATTAGFNQAVTMRQAVTIFLGNARCLIAATGKDMGTIFTPNNTLEVAFEADNGSFAGFVDGADLLVITGGDLDRVGPLVTGAYVNNGEQGWFVVGGVGGCTILARPDGTGITTLSKGFNGLDSSFSMHPLGIPGIVRKIIADESRLYILTNNALYRVALTPESIISGDVDLVELAQIAILPEGDHIYLSDFVVSGDRGILATSRGLLVTNNNLSIATALHGSDLWRFFELPESPGGVVYLHPISAIGPTGWAKSEGGGMVEALAATVSENQARIYRLATNNSATEYVQLMNDMFIAGRNSFYCSAGSYRSGAWSEGISLYFVRSGYYPTKSAPFFSAITPQPRVAMRSVIRQASEVVKRAENRTITAPIRDSGAGWLMLGGDGGLILND